MAGPEANSIVRRMFSLGIKESRALDLGELFLLYPIILHVIPLKLPIIPMSLYLLLSIFTGMLAHSYLFLKTIDGCMPRGTHNGDVTFLKAPSAAYVGHPCARPH